MAKSKSGNKEAPAKEAPAKEVPAAEADEKAAGEKGEKPKTGKKETPKDGAVAKEAPATENEVPVVTWANVAAKPYTPNNKKRRKTGDEGEHVDEKVNKIAAITINNDNDLDHVPQDEEIMALRGTGKIQINGSYSYS